MLNCTYYAFEQCSKCTIKLNDIFASANFCKKLALVLKKILLGKSLPTYFVECIMLLLDRKLLTKLCTLCENILF